MRILVLSVMTCLLASCKEQQKSVSGNTSKFKTEFNKEFDESDHLFLNYYFKMSVEDFESATQVNFIQKKILLADERNDCRLSAFSDTYTVQEIEEINRLSKIYYVFGSGDDEFEASINPVFKNNQLVSIELRTLNCFTVGDHNHKFYRRKVNEINETLINLHKKDHGSYTRTPIKLSEYELASFKEAGISIDSFDINRYSFNDNGKIISIEQSCCDFKPVIVYSVEDTRLQEIL